MATFSGAAEWGSKSQVGDAFGTLNTWFPSCRPLKGMLCRCRTKCRWQGIQQPGPFSSCAEKSAHDVLL